ncbi:hypothetical protein COCOBI_18-0870 [Coccomyxa sp. Obi]|nr:hypothetical protein COCOBI_18-0870 [Coccomyxa sp. Obi]
MSWSKALERLSWKNLLQTFDKRRLQHEIDTHRLLLLTEHYARRARGMPMDEGQLASVGEEAQALSFDERRARLAQHLDRQITHIAKQVHAAVSGLDAPAYEEKQSAADRGAHVRPRGLWGMTGRSRSAAPTEPVQTASEAVSAQDRGTTDASTGDSATPSVSGPHAIMMKDVTARLQERMGFALHLAPSAVGHAEAGEGLWLKGRAKTGAVVGLYPGIVYTRSHYRDMPGYPKVDRESDFLISRFDGAILDAKPWGRGAPEEPPSAESLGYRGLQADTLAQLHSLERRHPFSLAHYANHPPAGRRPNIMIAAYDFREGQGGLRRYIPNVMFGHTLAKPQEDCTLSGSGTATDIERQVGPSKAVLCLALVATREIEDEELLLNYRLSPGLERPSWYTPVDQAEDSRRWS